MDTLAAVIPSLALGWFICKKSVGICIGYRPSVGGFSHCLSLLDGNEEAQRLYMQRKHPVS